MPSATQLYNTGRWLNAADLLPLNQRRTAIVQHVEEAQVGMGNDAKTQLNISLTSRQGQAWPKTLLLNKGNTMQMVAAFGDDYTFWTGKAIDVWAENVMFQGKMVPGIKVTPSANGAHVGQAHAHPGNATLPPNTQASPSPSATAATGIPQAANPGNLPRHANMSDIDDDSIPF